MGKKDTITKKFLSQPEVFADAFNYFLFDGESVIDPKELKEMDPSENAVVRKMSRLMTDQKMRDVFKSCTIRYSGNAALMLLGIEGQAEVHYAMPVRNCLYDALNYASQVDEIRRRHKKACDLKTSAEILSGFTKDDQLAPVITLCICFNNMEWDAPRSLNEMFRNVNPRLLQWVSDYRLNLITPSEIESFGKFSSELGLVLEFIRNSDDMEKMRDIMYSDSRYQSVDVSSVDMINVHTAADISISDAKGGKVDMCTAIKGLIAEGRAEGRAEGEDLLTRLFRSLTPGSEDFRKALNATPAERQELYKKYGITP